MVSKKDLLDVVAWASISAVIGVSASTVVPLFVQDDKKRALLKAGLNILSGSISGGIIGGRHVASMKDKYDDQDLDFLLLSAVASTSIICGMLAGYSGMPIISDKQDSINHLTNTQNNLKQGMELMAEWCSVTMIFGLVSLILSLEIASNGLEMTPLRFPNFEEKASLKLKEVLSYDERQDKDIFKTLERYNKVYKKMFTKLGTPYEMAKITNNKEVAKKIDDKNNQLIVQALLQSKFSKDNAMINL